MKRGFTLVELLAVIVILSVIAIITVPIIGNVIEESRKKALEQSAYGLVEAADYYAINNDGEYSFLFDNNHKGENIDKTKQLEYKGSIEGEGKLYINNNGDISLCINTDKYTVYKSYNGEIVIENISDKGECNVKKLGNHYVAYLENEGAGDYITSSDLALYALKTDLNNYVTNEDLQDAFDLKLGTGTLTTESQNVIGAINEVNTELQNVKSHIGMIVQSTTLDTEDKVKAIYGGTAWTKIEGKFLLGQSDTYEVNATGGEASHTLTLDEIPRHTHNFTINFGSGVGASYGYSPSTDATGTIQTDPYGQIVGHTGGSQAHNNMPPYYTVYIWLRTA